MKRWSAGTTASGILFLLCAMLVLPAPASASDFGVSVIAQRGFGDPRNDYAWSMAWFKGKLYVGTSRQELCVEDLTVDFYLPVADEYSTNADPGVHCPANPNNLALRAEIWQYTPGTGRWRMVYVSPVIRNPSAPRKFIARDIAYRGMVVYHDGQGRPALYVGAVTADEFLPELKRLHPPQLLRTVDGVHFQSVGARNVIVREPYGIFRPMGFRSMIVWRRKLFVTLSSGLTGDGSVYEVDRPWSSHIHFRQVSPANLAVFEIQPFDGRLYLGTGDRQMGYGVWRTEDRRGALHFKPVVTEGAGRGQQVTSVVSMHVFRHMLYVGSAGWYNGNALPVSELIRIGAGDRWQVVAGAPRIVRGVLKAPISGLVDGFDNIFAAHFWRMASWGGGLYVGTNDWSWLIQLDTRDPWLQSILSPEFGFDVWATCDGADWFPVTRDGFGNMYDFGARNFVGSPFGLFIGSADHAQGTTIYRDSASPCSSLINGPRASSATAATPPAAPQQLLTDVQRRGTVLSWIPSARAKRYTVLRAAYDIRVPFSYRIPFTFPNGFHTDDAVPIPAAPGSPGSTQTYLPIPGPFTPVGTTASADFVDRSAPRGVRVAYQVVAQSATGAFSARSNLQVVPDPRPPATFQQLADALGESARAVEARVGWSTGDRRAEVLELARLLRSSNLAPDARELAYRLERRIEYYGVAGGP